MAIYENLPVFKASYDLMIELFQMTHNLSREYKYTVGEKLKTELLELMTQIYLANTVTDKSKELSLARQKIVVVKLYIRVLFDMKQIPMKRFTAISEKTEIISKQLAAWHKSAGKKTNTN